MSNPNLTKRPATEQDITFARQVHHEAYHDVVTRQFGHWNDKDQGKFFDAAWNHQGLQILLWGNQPCGYCRIEDRDDEIHIDELVLLPEFQGKGIGSVLLNETKSRAAERGVPVRLQVLKANRAAELYERQGFTYIGETQNHKQMQWTPNT